MNDGASETDGPNIVGRATPHAKEILRGATLGNDGPGGVDAVDDGASGTDDPDIIGCGAPDPEVAHGETVRTHAGTTRRKLAVCRATDRGRRISARRKGGAFRSCGPARRGRKRGLEVATLRQRRGACRNAVCAVVEGDVVDPNVERRARTHAKRHPENTFRIPRRGTEDRIAGPSRCDLRQ